MGVALDDYLRSLGQGETALEPGEFTIAAERARALLAGKALSDVRMAWLCLAQGFIGAGALSLELECSARSAVLRVGLKTPTELEELLRNERFLLGWLNLGWFGTPHWEPHRSTLTVPWQGHAWKRYRFASTLPRYLSKALRYAPLPVHVRIGSVNADHLPNSGPVCLYPLPRGRKGGMLFRDSFEGHPSFYERRRFPLPGSEQSDPDYSGPLLAAFAWRTNSSGSEITWVSHGVIIGTEQNTLERPRVAVVASVDALELETDLSGFQVVNSAAYHRFTTELKRNVLWMLG